VSSISYSDCVVANYINLVGLFTVSVLRLLYLDIIKQEAQLSQRPRALCVIEYIAKSLKVIRNDTIE